MCVFAASHAHLSGHQQCVIDRLLHVDPHVVHYFELLDVSLSLTDCCFKVPFPQELKEKETQKLTVWGDRNVTYLKVYTNNAEKHDTTYSKRGGGKTLCRTTF